MFAHAWLNNRVLQSLLSEGGKAYWVSKCSIAEGLWPFGVDPDSGHGVAPTPAEYRQANAASLMASSCYTWVYSRDAYETMLGRGNQSYPGQAAVSEYLPFMRERLMATNSEYVRVAQDLRRLTLRDYGQDLGLALCPALIGPRQEIAIEILPRSIYGPSYNAALQDALWDTGRRLMDGEMVDTPAIFPAQRDWLLLGPFANREKSGLATVYPPEQGIDLKSEVEGMNGKVHWTEYHCPSGSVMVDLAKQFKPSDEVCAYALCYAKTDQARDVQFRISGNDVWKLWVGGKPVHESGVEGRIVLDREILPVSLAAGTTPILVKVCNNRRDWGFVMRITDREGKAVPGLKVGLSPE